MLCLRRWGSELCVWYIDNICGFVSRSEGNFLTSFSSLFFFSLLSLFLRALKVLYQREMLSYHFSVVSSGSLYPQQGCLGAEKPNACPLVTHTQDTVTTASPLQCPACPWCWEPPASQRVTKLGCGEQSANTGQEDRN